MRCEGVLGVVSVVRRRSRWPGVQGWRGQHAVHPSNVRVVELLQPSTGGARMPRPKSHAGSATSPSNYATFVKANHLICADPSKVCRNEDNNRIGSRAGSLFIGT